MDDGDEFEMILDRLLFDLALHTFRGAFGATHGRSYKKDKNTALHENTFNLAKLLFDETEYEYTSTGDAGAALLARARRYRLPAVILDVATSKAPFADRERMGIAFDEFAPVFSDYPAPYGFSFEGEEDGVLVWDLFNKDHVTGIFQFEGNAVRGLAKQMPIENIDDISALGALASIILGFVEQGT